MHDTQLSRATDGSGEENRADIDAEAVNPEPLRPSAEQLAFAARQVQHALARLEPANGTQGHQFLVSEWIQDAVIRLSNLVLPK